MGEKESLAGEESEGGEERRREGERWEKLSGAWKVYLGLGSVGWWFFGLRKGLVFSVYKRL